MASVTIENKNRVLQRLRNLRREMSPESPALRAALTKIALIIVNQAKINVRRHGLIDEGRLINSIRFEFFRSGLNRYGVAVGSFGVPYAATWEFGFHGVQQISGHNRLVTQAFGQPIPPVIASVRPHTRRVNRQAKPFLRPAFQQHRNKIDGILKEALFGT